MKIRLVTVLFLLSLFATCEMVAQGKLMGQIVSKEGTPVSGVAVYISGSNSSQATISNAQGYYVFLSVPEGSYELKASRRGQSPWRKKVSISNVQIQRLDIHFGSEPVLALAAQPETNASESKAKREEKSKDKASPASTPSAKALESRASESKQNEPQPVSPPASQNDETLTTLMSQAEAAAKTFAESEFALAEKEIEVDGGMEAIYKKLVYPMAAEKAGIEGKVVVRIAVDKEGNVSQVLLISSASPLLNEEVFRVITEEVKFKPAIMDGKPVPSVITIPISFKLR